MIEVMNFFQAMFMLKIFTPASVSKCEVKLAAALKTEAMNLEKVAVEEVKNGKTAHDLAAAATDENKIRIFTEIAVWHYNRAAGKYRKAAARFEEAGKVYLKKAEGFRSKAVEMMCRAIELEGEIKNENTK